MPCSSSRKGLPALDPVRVNYPAPVQILEVARGTGSDETNGRNIDLLGRRLADVGPAIAGGLETTPRDQLAPTTVDRRGKGALTQF